MEKLEEELQALENLLAKEEKEWRIELLEILIAQTREKMASIG